MTQNPRELALQLAIATLITDIASEHKDTLRDQLKHALDAAGADATRAEVGTDRIAKVALVQPKPKAVVTNEDAFTKHVAMTRPDEIVTKVRDSYKRVLLDSLVAGPDGVAIDPATGELIEGVTFMTGGGYVSTRFEKDGRATLTEALQNGTLTYNLTQLVTPALEAGADRG